jgi:hypothetical protein
MNVDFPIQNDSKQSQASNYSLKLTHQPRQLAEPTLDKPAQSCIGEDLLNRGPGILRLTNALIESTQRARLSTIIAGSRVETHPQSQSHTQGTARGFRMTTSVRIAQAYR